MTSDEIKALLFCVRWTNQHLGGRLLEREKMARREGQDIPDSPLVRAMKIANRLADRLEAKFLPPKPGPTDEEKEGDM